MQDSSNMNPEFKLEAPHDADSKNLEPLPLEPNVLAPGDFYFEGRNMVFTAQYHLKRGSCCGSGCRHCPY